VHEQIGRSRPRRTLLAILLALSLPLLALGGIAAAAGVSSATGLQCPPGQVPVTTPTGVICVASVGGGGGSGSPTTGGGGSGGGGICTSSWSNNMPCYVAGEGWWDGDLQCYVELANPQPPASSPVWDGHQPGDGAIWQATCPLVQSTNHKLAHIYDYWSKTPPAGQSPAALLSQAEAELVMHGPAIGTAPKHGGLTLVGLPVWMWTTASKQTWGPQTVTVSADGMTLTATAKAARIVWNMGDGDSVTCASPGTPYQTAYGAVSSPSCGYTYDTSAVYNVTATAYWTVTWTATELGVEMDEGTATPPPVQSATTIRVGELQVLTND
jgi:hypothetical protein